MKRTAGLAIALLSLLAPAIARAESTGTSPPLVTLGAGRLQGSLAEGGPGAVFKGVPFAQPPVGRLRWREPQPATQWQGTRQATGFAPACFQLSRGAPAGDEDCLYLNVWTPEWPLRGSYPVMLWLFGGANVTGSAANPVFDGAALARHGVVVVTTNFRVGVMGFMAHPALSRESTHDSSGNYALLDQVMALRWIQANIAAFGGDPQQVTLFGQSSGSYDLLLLMTSPLARSLFHRAIAQAGQLLSYDGSMPRARAEALGVSIAADLGAPAQGDVLAYLRSLPAERVAAAGSRWLPTDLASDTGLLTHVDGWVLPELPAQVFATGRQAAIPLVIGNNAREITPQVDLAALRAQILGKYGADLGQEALEAYGLANGAEGRIDPLLGGPGSQWMTDTVQRCAAGMEADWHAAAGRPTWQYQFERSVPGREADGAHHGAELAFVFGTLGIAAGNASAFAESDRRAARQMQEYWTRFAHTGDPNVGSLPAWPRAGDGHYLAFTADGPAARQRVKEGPCAVFEEWTLRRLANRP